MTCSAACRPHYVYSTITLDLNAAHDRVPRPLLWDVLRRLGIQGAVLAAVQAVYGSATLAVTVGRRQEPNLQSLAVVKQGCPLSPAFLGRWSPCFFCRPWLTQMALLWHSAVISQISGRNLGHDEDSCLISAIGDCPHFPLHHPGATLSPNA